MELGLSSELFSGGSYVPSCLQVTSQRSHPREAQDTRWALNTRAGLSESMQSGHGGLRERGSLR